MRRQQFEQLRDSARTGFPTAPRARVERLGLDQAGVDAREPHGRRACRDQRRDQFMIHAACEHLKNGVDGLGRSHAQPVHEAAFDPAFGEEARHLLAAAVHHHQLGPACAAAAANSRGQPRARFRSIEQRTAELHQDLHSSPSVSVEPNARFRF